ncbi:hypothetical protein ACJX0J_016639, partial [Zea mays]
HHEITQKMKEPSGHKRSRDEKLVLRDILLPIIILTLGITTTIKLINWTMQASFSWETVENTIFVFVLVHP